MKLYILAGVPGCGKTTWATKLLPGVWVSSDAIRQEMFPDEYDATHNAAVFARFYKVIDKHLLNGWDVIADATNLRSFARSELRSIAEITGATTHLIFFTNVEQAVLRNSFREGQAHGAKKVPNEGMELMLEKYEEAQRDIPLEQYTTVTYIGGVS